MGKNAVSDLSFRGYLRIYRVSQVSGIRRFMYCWGAIAVRLISSASVAAQSLFFFELERGVLQVEKEARSITERACVLGPKPLSRIGKMRLGCSCDYSVAPRGVWATHGAEGSGLRCQFPRRPCWRIDVALLPPHSCPTSKQEAASFPDRLVALAVCPHRIARCVCAGTHFVAADYSSKMQTACSFVLRLAHAWAISQLGQRD